MHLLVGWPFGRFFHVLHCMPVAQRLAQPKWLILLLLGAGTEQSRCPSLFLPALVLCWAVHEYLSTWRHCF